VLSGRCGPAVLEALAEADGAIAATAFAHLPYNRHSAHRDSASAGLAAVAPGRRGQGLGAAVNARALARAVGELGAARVQEFAAAENAASRRMIERCGLLRDPGVLSGIVAARGAGRFTR
jgi:RimJ/RimL family protein N-acetyltransferase